MKIVLKSIEVSDDHENGDVQTKGEIGHDEEEHGKFEDSNVFVLVSFRNDRAFRCVDISNGVFEHVL